MRYLRLPSLTVRAALCVAALAGCDATTSPRVAPSLAEGARAHVLPADAHPHGHSFAEWAALWWQYVLSVPASENPLLDETGENCGVGQEGHVFFLVGILNVSGTAVRTECVVPTGTMLLFPVVNTICTNEPPPFIPTEELAPCAAGPIETATDLLVEIDGVPVRDLERHRTRSGVFGFTLPEDNLLGGAAGSCSPDPDVGTCVPYLAAADGFYVMLPPLPPGEHSVHIHGVMPAFGGFTLDVTYDPLIVVQRNG
jgi:hypothetical protein